MRLPCVFLPLLLLCAACETRVGAAGITGGGATAGGGSTAQSALVGEWSLIFINRDPTGALVSSSETRWRFDGNGDARRTSIATSFITGIQDVVESTGRWTATSSQVTITLAGGTQMTLPWRVERNGSSTVLTLGTLTFVRR